MTITRIAIHNANRLYWVAKMADLAAAHPADDTGLEAVYYDGQMTCYKAADYTKDPSTWYPKAQACARPYRDYWVIGQGAGQGYRYFPQGLAEDVIRNGTLTSKNALQILLTTGYAVQNGTTGNPYGEYYLQGEHGTRETAYALMTHLEARRISLAANYTRIATLYSYALHHLDMWMPGGGSTYLRPFMAALTAKALIQYYEQKSADATIVTKIAALFDFIWNTMWGAADSSGSLSFKYTNINTATLSTTYTNAGGTISNPAYNSGGTEASVNLNLLIVPVFGWLYSVTKDPKWKTRGDLIFDEGIAVYNSDHTVWTRGAFLGSASAPNGKFIDQNFWWSDKYADYAGDSLITMTAAKFEQIIGLARQGTFTGALTSSSITTAYTYSVAQLFNTASQ